jgi:hypothetical protein
VTESESETVRRIIDQLDDPSQASAIAASIDGFRQCEISFTCEGRADIVAGSIVDLKDLLELSGRYVVTSARHMAAKEWTVSVTAENLE